jgi:hypothetical protein
MKTLDRKVFNRWLKSLPPKEAMIKLMVATGYGVSTLQKIMSGHYKFELKPPVRTAISKVVGVEESKLWRDDD